MIKFKRPKLLLFIAIGAALIAWSFGYFVDFNVPKEELPSPKKIESPKVTPPTTPPPGTSAPIVVKLTVEGDEFSFSPKKISVKKGVQVELTFKNIGKAPHNFIVDELSIATKTIGAGKTDTVIFTAPDNTGTITYASYCSVPGHRAAGMEGTIVVE